MSTDRIKSCFLFNGVHVSPDLFGPAVVSALLVPLIVVVLAVGMFCLCYTGFICKLKKGMPQALTVKHDFIYLNLHFENCHQEPYGHLPKTSSVHLQLIKP